MPSARKLLLTFLLAGATAACQTPSAAPVSPHQQGIDSFRKSDYLQAATYLKRALAENPADREATQLLGLSYFYLGSATEAIPLLEKVRSWYPSANVDASYVLGLLYIQARDYAKARNSFAEMYGVPPDSAAAYLFTARMLLRQGFDPVAEEHAQKAVALDPKLPLAHFLLGEFYLYKSRIPEAMREFQTELALNPGFAHAYDRLADAHFRSGNFDEAQKLLQRSILLDSTSTGSYVLMGNVMLKKGDPIQAMRYLKIAVKMDPNNFITHHLLGEAYRAAGDKPNSERELKQAEQLQSAQNPKLE